MSKIHNGFLFLLYVIITGLFCYVIFISKTLGATLIEPAVYTEIGMSDAEVLTGASIDTMVSINNERKAKGIFQLQTDAFLLCAAQQHVLDISAKKKCTHTGSNGSSFSNRAKKCGFVMKSGGEIIACGQKSARQAVDAWLKSPGHNSILFSKDYTRFGCEMKNNYWVCVLGR